jgi:nucleotide-binding universal stress UspA family protein
MTARTLLVVVDDSKEMPVALRYAAWRARMTKSRVAMLHMIEAENSIQPWAGVEATLTEDAMKRAHTELEEYEKLVKEISGVKPLWYVKKGDRKEALLELLKEKPEVSALILAAHTGNEGPGPLVSYLTSAKGIRKIKIPLMIVPDTYEIPSDHRLV